MTVQLAIKIIKYPKIYLIVLEPSRDSMFHARNSWCLSQICTKSFGVTFVAKIDVGDHKLNKQMGIEAVLLDLQHFTTPMKSHE